MESFITVKMVSKYLGNVNCLGLEIMHFVIMQGKVNKESHPFNRINYTVIKLVLSLGENGGNILILKIVCCVLNQGDGITYLNFCTNDCRMDSWNGLFVLRTIAKWLNDGTTDLYNCCIATWFLWSLL